MQASFRRNKYNNHTESVLASFGRQVKERRKELGLTRLQAAELALVHYESLAKIEQGRSRNITIYLLISISDALDFYEWEFFSLKRL